MGHPCLKTAAAPVEDPTASDIETLVADMIDTMRDASGIGLAAPQVMVSKRVVVFHIPEVRARATRYGTEEANDPADGARDLTVMINPVIEPIGEELLEGPESCLSIPGFRGSVKRHAHVRYRYTDLAGAEYKVEAKCFQARVVSHECDHLDGILYPQRMEDLSGFGFTDELERIRFPIRRDPRDGNHASATITGDRDDQGL